MSDSDCPYKLEPKMYDIVMMYCRSCQKKLDVPVAISEKLNNYKVYCNNCGNTNIIENRFGVFTMKLDCSNMDAGMDSWYENNSSSDGDGHPRKF